MEDKMNLNEKERKPENNRDSLSGRSLRMGGYSVAITAIVIIAAVFVNLIVNRIPSKYTRIDNSSVGLYSITPESEEIAKSVGEDVMIYLVAEQGSEDNTIVELIGRYTGLNSKIKYRQIDPALYPNFTEKYTAATLSDSSVIVESAKRSQVIDYNDIYVTDYSIDENTYQIKTSSSYAGEARLTSALKYVTTDDIPKIYILGGHGEAELTETMKNYLRDDNFELADLNLLTSESVPSDADCVLINFPTADINPTESDMLLNYLKGGGSLVLFTGFSDDTPRPNIQKLGEYYGMTGDWGLVVEGSANHYNTYPYFLLPKIGAHDIISSMPTENFFVMMPYSMGIKVAETAPRATVKVTNLLYTSNSAYSKHGEISDLEPGDGDTEGPFAIAAIAEEGNTRFLWFTSPYLLDETIDQYVAGGNSTFFLTSMGWIGGKSESVSIATKQLQVAALVLTETEKNIWSVVIAAIIPITVILIGLRVWIKRRRA
ncbi:MAG: Gldg family protein [Eubacteriales bacterium]|jgi:ABC-2 type transport system permease protein